MAGTSPGDVPCALAGLQVSARVRWVTGESNTTHAGSAPAVAAPEQDLGYLPAPSTARDPHTAPRTVYLRDLRALKLWSAPWGAGQSSETPGKGASGAERHPTPGTALEDRGSAPPEGRLRRVCISPESGLWLPRVGRKPCFARKQLLLPF